MSTIWQVTAIQRAGVWFLIMYELVSQYIVWLSFSSSWSILNAELLLVGWHKTCNLLLLQMLKMSNNVCKAKLRNSFKHFSDVNFFLVFKIHIQHKRVVTCYVFLISLLLVLSETYVSIYVYRLYPHTIHHTFTHRFKFCSLFSVSADINQAIQACRFWLLHMYNILKYHSRCKNLSGQSWLLNIRNLSFFLSGRQLGWLLMPMCHGWGNYNFCATFLIWSSYHSLLQPQHWSCTQMQELPRYSSRGGVPDYQKNINHASFDWICRAPHINLNIMQWPTFAGQ